MTDAPAWPGEPGVPPDPDNYDKYWLKRGSYTLADWRRHGWKIWDEPLTPEQVVARGWMFGGPLLNPAEIAKREREAELRGWEAACEYLHENGKGTCECQGILEKELARRRAEMGT